MNFTPEDRAKLMITHGSEHIHKKWGRVMVFTCHPHDGCCLIIERTDPLEDDELVMSHCEASDLGPALADKVWPFLGFNCYQRQTDSVAHNEEQRQIRDARDMS
jgi:hypothetical protein